MHLTPDQAFDEFRADFIGHLSERLDIPPEAVRDRLRDYLLEAQEPEPTSSRRPKA